MSTRKLTESFYDLTKFRLSNSSILNLFNIMQDSDDNKFVNFFRSYVFNDDVTTNIVFFDTYQVDNDDWWDTISYKYYGTPYLWWVVALTNNIMNPFEELNTGDDIKILKEQYIYQLLKEMKSISEL